MPPFRILSPEMMSNQMAVEIHNAIVGFGCSLEFVVAILFGLLVLTTIKGIQTQQEKETLQQRVQHLEQAAICPDPEQHQSQKVSHPEPLQRGMVTTAN